MSLVKNLIRAGIKNVDDLARQVMPAILQTGDSVLVEKATNALRKMGASVPSQPGTGLLGTRSVPTSRQLGQAPVPQFGPGAARPTAPAGSRPVTTLAPQPYQGPRTRGGPLVQTSQAAPAPATRTQFTEDLISTPVVQGPARPPVQGPSMTGRPVQGQLDLRFGPGSSAVAEYTTTKGAVRPVGTNLGGQPYRSGPVATERNIQTLRTDPELRRLQADGTIGRDPVEAFRAARTPEGQRSFFETSGAPDIFSGEYYIRPELLRQLPKEVQDRIGTVMMREAADLGPAAPRPSFGAAAGPVPVDLAVDLGTLMNDPGVRAALGVGGLSLFGLGVTGMMNNRIGKTTAGSPPNLPTQPPSVEDNGSLPGTPGSNLSGGGSTDPGLAAPVVTTGGDQRGSAVREALAQTSPAASAVLRATEPMSPEKYRSIEEYAAAKQAFAQAKPEIQALMRYMETQSPTAGGGLAMWASRYPDLAASYQARQQALVNPAANQQGGGSVTSTTVTSAAGPDVTAAAVGNAQAIADAALTGNQAAVAIADWTRPQVQPRLERAETFIQRQAPRSAMYGGY